MDYLTLLLNPRSCGAETLMKEAENFTFENFIDMKKNWLKAVKTDWQIYGHINKEDAINLVKE